MFALIESEQSEDTLNLYPMYVLGPSMNECTAFN